jgi:two-component system chemotaxis response regulator CheY
MSQQQRAMVVDDSRAIRMILGRTLREMGWQVAEAHNGRDAWGRLTAQAEPFALILVDWNMPEMNGIEFVRAVRGDSRYAETKLMMVTTETQVEQIMTALEAGANEYVMKPFTSDVIHGKLRLLGLE